MYDRHLCDQPQGVSWPKERNMSARGSLNMFTFGAQNVNPWYMPLGPLPSMTPLFLPLPSVDVTSPIACHRDRLWLAATRPICGKLVPSPSRATPCNASDHQLYAGHEMRGTAPTPFVKSPAFSLGWRFDTSIATRSESAFVWSHQGKAVTFGHGGPTPFCGCSVAAAAAPATDTNHDARASCSLIAGG
jgi:hypothetical protein